jgi:hypothetical protein
MYSNAAKWTHGSHHNYYIQIGGVPCVHCCMGRVIVRTQDEIICDKFFVQIEDDGV